MPDSVVRAIPKGVMRWLPEIASIRDVVWFLEFGEIRMKCSHSVVHETEWRVVDDVSRDDKGIGVFDLVGDEFGDGAVFDPKLAKLAVA